MRPDSLLPVVDLSAGEKPASQALLRACREHGFFYLIGHGVDEELIHRVFEQSRKFFGLELGTKMKCSTLRSTCNRGYTPMLEETLDPKRQRIGDTKEGFYIGTKTSPNEAAYAGLPLHGLNQFPDDGVLPGWRECMESYHRALTDLGHRMARVVALSLDLAPDFFTEFLQKPMASLRLLHYSQMVSEPEDGVFACGAHSDYGMLTFLAIEPGDEGLQVLEKAGNPDEPDSWRPVDHMHGSFVVNVGDMLERWTNGQFRSTPHRVVNKRGVERYSVPFFFDPDFNALVKCVPTCCSDDNPPKQTPVSAGEHLMDMYSQTHADYKKHI